MKLTPRQRTVLTELQRGADLVYEADGGWWIGRKLTNGKLGRKLVELALVSRDRIPGDAYERYTINERGRRALAGLPPYRLADGRYLDTPEEVELAARQRAEGGK